MKEDRNRDRISWATAILLSVISSILSFVIFMFLQVIEGDIIKDTMKENYENGLYFNVSILLLLGILLIFVSNIIIQIVIYRKKYLLEPRLVSNAFTIIITFILLLFISWSSILFFYPEFSNKDFIDQVKQIGNLFSIFSIYIFPGGPPGFWILTNIIYNLILIIFIKKLYIRKY